MWPFWDLFAQIRNINFPGKLRLVLLCPQGPLTPCNKSENLKNHFQHNNVTGRQMDGWADEQTATARLKKQTCINTIVRQECLSICLFVSIKYGIAKANFSSKYF